MQVSVFHSQVCSSSLVLCEDWNRQRSTAAWRCCAVRVLSSVGGFARSASARFSVSRQKRFEARKEPLGSNTVAL